MSILSRTVKTTVTILPREELKSKAQKLSDILGVFIRDGIVKRQETARIQNLAGWETWNLEPMLAELYGTFWVGEHEPSISFVRVMIHTETREVTHYEYELRAGEEHPLAPPNSSSGWEWRGPPILL